MKKITIKARILGAAVFSSVLSAIIVLVLAILQIVTTHTIFTYMIAGVAISLFLVNLIAIPEYKKYILESDK